MIKYIFLVLGDAAVHFHDARTETIRSGSCTVEGRKDIFLTLEHLISATKMLKLRYFIQSSSIASIETEEFLYLIQENNMIMKINKVFQIKYITCLELGIFLENWKWKRNSESYN